MAKTTTKGSISYIQETEVAVPAKAVALPIAIHQWERLRLRVSQCEEQSPFYEGLGWGLLGAGLGALASLIALYASVDYLQMKPLDEQPGGKLVATEHVNTTALWSSCILAVLAISCISVGIISLRFASIERGRRKSHAGMIVSEMDSIRNTFESLSTTVAAAPSSSAPLSPKLAESPEPKIVSSPEVIAEPKES